MELRLASYTLRYHIWCRRREREWVIWYPGIDVMTQARTKKKALESIREAGELWFESCIARGVLNEALTEVGFCKVLRNEAPKGVDFVEVIRQKPTQPHAETRISFSLRRRTGFDHMEGTITWRE